MYFFKLFQNSLVQRLKHYRKSAKQHANSVRNSYSRAEGEEYATPYPGSDQIDRHYYERVANGPNEPIGDTYKKGTCRSTTTTPEGAVGGIRLYDDDECMNRDDVTRPRPVAYVKPLSSNQTENNPSNLSYIQVEVHQPKHTMRPNNQESNLIDLTKLSNQERLNIGRTKSVENLLKPQQHLNMNDYSLIKQQKTFNEGSATLGGARPKKPSKAQSLQNLAPSMQHAVPSVSCYDNTGYEPDAGNPRRAQSVCDLAFTAPVVVTKDISV